MPLHPTLEDILLRLVVAFAAGFLIGFNRGERNEAVGLRTTLLVGMAATFAGVLANLLLSTTGKDPHDFAQIDVLRLPLGILSGIGFIGAGAIIKKEDIALGVTTAATIWVISVIGLCFGTGFLGLGSGATAMTLAVLWGLRWIDKLMPRALKATIAVEASGALTEGALQEELRADRYRITAWSAEYHPQDRRCFTAVLQWRGREGDMGKSAPIVGRLASRSEITSVKWNPADLGS